MCGLSRMVQVRGYAVRLFCELPEDAHTRHWDGTFGVEWEESYSKSRTTQITVHTSESVTLQPRIA